MSAPFHQSRGPRIRTPMGAGILVSRTCFAPSQTVTSAIFTTQVPMHTIGHSETTVDPLGVFDVANDQLLFVSDGLYLIVATASWSFPGGAPGRYGIVPASSSPDTDEYAVPATGRSAANDGASTTVIGPRHFGASEFCQLWAGCDNGAGSGAQIMIMVVSVAKLA